jgi:hypothetical protein
MQLSEHDLKQLNEQRIRDLQAEALRNLSVKLLTDLKEARDRLNQNPDNSSRPPSSRAPWEKGHQDGQEEREGDDGEDERRSSRATRQPNRKIKRARGKKRNKNGSR